MATDTNNIDMNFGLSHQALAVARYLYATLPHTFIENDCGTTISDVPGIEILTQVLLNGRERGLLLYICFYGEADEHGVEPILSEQLINFGESRTSDDIFVMWSEPVDGGELGYGPYLVEELGENAYRDRRKQFKEGHVGPATDFICKLICQLYKRAKKFERKLQRATKKAS